MTDAASPLASDPISEERYRLLSSYAASGVAVVSTRVGDRDYAATVSAWFSVSYDPPTMLVSLFELSRIAEAVADSGTWALSLLNRDQEQTAKWLSSPGAPVEGLFNQVPHHRGPLTDAAIIDGVIAWFELRTVDVHTAATHQLFVGRVLSQGRSPSQGPDAATSSRGPLIHYASMYRRLER
ncbi:flavin reductase family protein [Salinibacterium sp. ZJ454]|uniref:flavin reductase family protein n=1 Tax=Salinibacterium sp. ZJ454 TaxID=2708339 RepID=UPI001421FC69|nr:flavin reductase family protein [Salinibacterium sp. ZJ454]